MLLVSTFSTELLRLSMHKPFRSLFDSVDPIEHVSYGLGPVLEYGGLPPFFFAAPRSRIARSMSTKRIRRESRFPKGPLTGTGDAHTLAHTKS